MPDDRRRDRGRRHVRRDARARPVRAECWLLDVGDAGDHALVEDRRTGIGGSGRTALRLSIAATGDDGRAALSVPPLSGSRRLVLEVRRGATHVRLPLPAVDPTAPLRLVVPD